MSKGRLEAFSDGVFAIIITIIVLGMTLPDVFTAASTQAFLWEIFIFIEGGLIIGQFGIHIAGCLIKSHSFPHLPSYLIFYFY